MKAITTKHHGPTEKRADRFSATDNDGNRISIPRTETDNEYMHHLAARALCKKLGWTGMLAVGALDATERVFVWVEPGTLRPDPLLAGDDRHLPTTIAREIAEQWQNGNRKEAVRRLMTAYTDNRLASFRLLDAVLIALRREDETFEESTLWTLCGTYQSGQWK